MTLFGQVREFLFGGGSPSLPDHVVREPAGGLRPAAGYAWVTTTPGDYRVQWLPGKVWEERHLMAGPRPGKWTPADGYSWIRPHDPDCHDVTWEPGKLHPRHANVVAAPVEGVWAPAPGFRWVDPDSDEPRVQPVDQRDEWGSGVSHRRRAALAVLGLDASAARSDVEAAFRRLVKVHHPDRFTEQGYEAVEAANRSFTMLRAAYESLTGEGGRS